MNETDSWEREINKEVDIRFSLDWFFSNNKKLENSEREEEGVDLRVEESTGE